MRIAGWLLMGMVTTAALAGASEFPAGKFEGKGTWRGPGGSTGSYAVSTEIDGRTMTNRYVWKEPGKADRVETITVSFGDEGKNATFPITDGAGKVVGEGFCFEGACSYKTASETVTVSETIRWSDGKLQKLGTKSGPGFQVVWTEDLASR